MKPNYFDLEKARADLGLARQHALHACAVYRLAIQVKRPYHPAPLARCCAFLKVVKQNRTDLILEAVQARRVLADLRVLYLADFAAQPMPVKKRGRGRPRKVSNIIDLKAVA